MPLTALFPEDHEKITISQGQVGDCYLLATLDCVANLGKEGRERLKSLFTQTKDGVTVRIPRSEISDNLQIKKVETRYAYSYDADKKQDVFFISNALLDEMDAATSIGATSNSLAVKILEHLSSYYFAKGWSRKDAINSLTAHSAVQERHGMSSTMFVSRLINVQAQHLNTDQIIKLKSLYPNFPVYVSINWGETHLGASHERHALRVEKVTKNSSSYNFSLINPWDNTAPATSMTKAAIDGKDPYFAVFTLHPQTMKFVTKILLELPEPEAQLVAKTPTLSLFLKKLQVQLLAFGVEDSKRVIALYKVMPEIHLLYTSLKKEERVKFQHWVYEANGNKDVFIDKYLSKMTRIEGVRELVRNEVPASFTHVIVTRCIPAKDQELFKLLNKHGVDVLGQLMYSSMNKDLFLQNLIELEMQQKPSSPTRLKNIDTYIKAFNKANPSKALTARIDESLIAAAIVTSETTAVVEAQFIVGQTLDALSKFEVSFKEITDVKALEGHRDGLLEQLEDLENEGFKAALVKLNSKDREKIELMFHKKQESILSESLNRGKQLKNAEGRIASFLDLIRALPVSFANDFSSESVQRHGTMFMKQIENLSRKKELQAALLTLGVVSHPEVEQAIKGKIEKINSLMEARINLLNQALTIIQATAKRIAELAIVIPNLQSTAAFQEEQTKQVKLVQALMEEPAVVEANKQLGVLGHHPLITTAFDTKQKEIASAIQKKSAVIVEANKKAQAYQNSIKAITVDFSKATTEKEVIAVSLTFFREIEKIWLQIEADQSLTVLLSAKEELLAVWKKHQQFADDNNIVAHNRVVYSQMQKALEASGFVFALNQVVHRAEATKTMITMGHNKHIPYEQPSQELCETVNKARDELMTKPKEGKVSSVQAKEKIEAFQRKVLAAITKAGKVLNGAVDWQTRLSALEESTSMVKVNFAGSAAPVNPHGFYAKPISKPSTAPRTGLPHPTLTTTPLAASASVARATVAAA